MSLAYPSWLNFKEPEEIDQGYRCPYCKRIFSKKNEAYPKLVMSFQGYQRNILRYPNLESIIESHWRSDEGHPCMSFTDYFWNEVQKLSDISKKNLKSEARTDDEKYHYKHYKKSKETFKKDFSIEDYIKNIIFLPYKIIEKIISFIFHIIFVSLAFLFKMMPFVIGLFILYYLFFLKQPIHPSNNPTGFLDNNQNFSESYFNKDFNENYLKGKYPHIIPYNKPQGKGIINKTRVIYYGLNKYYLNLTINKSIYLGAVGGFKEYEYYCVNDVCYKDPNWEEDYYKAFILDPYEVPLFKEIINQINIYAKNPNNFVELATSFVQNIFYDYDKTSSVFSSMRFPIEVVVQNLGVCSEKSLLLAGILYYAGYNVALLVFDNENHMAVAVKCNCKNTPFLKEYCFIETTGITPIGVIPKKYVGNVSLSSPTKIIYLKGSNKTYTNCRYIDKPLFIYSQEITEPLTSYLQQHFKLKYSSSLTNAIKNDDFYIPGNYNIGKLWSFEIHEGNPNFTVAYVIRCIFDNRCKEFHNGKFVSDPYEEEFLKDLKNYKYFGLKIEKEKDSYYLRILLAK